LLLLALTNVLHGPGGIAQEEDALDFSSTKALFSLIPKSIAKDSTF
jgi:hypothetical protein